MVDTPSLEDVPNPLIYAVALYAAAIVTGYVDAPDVPDWWPILAALVVAGGAVGILVGDKIGNLWPDQFDNLLVAQDAGREDGGAIFELNDAALDEMGLKKADSLFEWDWGTLECRNYNPDENVAVGNWKGTKTGSELSKPVTREQVMKDVTRLREQHEEDARFGEAVRKSIPALLRKLDKQRAQTLNAALEGRVTPDLGAGSIDDMIRDFLPDRVVPNYLMRDDDLEDERAEADVGDGVTLVLDGDVTDPLSDPPGPVATDGGDADE